MTIEKWLKLATKKLSEVEIDSARLDCLILLEDVISKDRAWILANHDYVLNTRYIEILDSYIGKRSEQVPLAYIRGKSEFFGNEFLLTTDTLQPRSETEIMIEMALKLKTEIKTCIDVGTGSGAIAISVKLHAPNLEVIATEIDHKALVVAKKNAARLGTDIKFVQGNLLESASSMKSRTMVLANLPYVPDNHDINAPAMNEPKLAIFGGHDGLDLYRNMFKQISNMPLKPIYILTESLIFQHNTLAKLASDQSYILKEKSGLIQLFQLNQ